MTYKLIFFHEDKIRICLVLIIILYFYNIIFKHKFNEYFLFTDKLPSLSNLSNLNTFKDENKEK